MKCKEAKNKNQLFNINQNKLKKNMSNPSIRAFREVNENDVVQAWKASKSKAEVAKRLLVTNFGSKERRLTEIIKKYNLPPFHLKLVENLSTSEIQAALNDSSLTSLKPLCVRLGLAKKIRNAELKERIKKEGLEVPEWLHKAVFGVASVPWTYPRAHFIKNNKEIPTTCPECGFEASVPSQIQLHHLDPLENQNSSNLNDQKEEDPLAQDYRGSSLKRKPGYNKTNKIATICANCHSLEHHPRGEQEKLKCGSWIGKKTTNQVYQDPTDMFVSNCPHPRTLQKKYFVRASLKTPDDYVCGECGISQWKGKPLVLQLHHRDGTHQNAQLSNLVLLCPNCHAATDSWGGKKQAN